MALSQTVRTELSAFPKTLETILKMCEAVGAEPTSQQREQLREVCLAFPEVWHAGDRPLATSNLTTLTVELVEGATAVAGASRFVAPHNRDRIAAAVKKGNDAGIYEPIEPEWAAPAVHVPREDPTGDRICADHRKLNERTRVPLLSTSMYSTRVGHIAREGILFDLRLPGCLLSARGREEPETISGLYYARSPLPVYAYVFRSGWCPCDAATDD